jgi:hypothetical protein
MQAKALSFIAGLRGLVEGISLGEFLISSFARRAGICGEVRLHSRRWHPCVITKTREDGRCAAGGDNRPGKVALDLIGVHSNSNKIVKIAVRSIAMAISG